MSLKEEALAYHAGYPKGKIGTSLTKNQHLRQHAFKNTSTDDNDHLPNANPDQSIENFNIEDIQC